MRVTILVNRPRVGLRELNSTIHHGVGVRIASHRGQHGRLRLQRREVRARLRGIPERFRDRLVRPDEGLVQIHLVRGGELRGGLPVLIVEAGPRPEVLAHLRHVQRIHVRHVNAQRKALVFHCRYAVAELGRRLSNP